MFFNKHKINPFLEIKKKDTQSIASLYSWGFASNRSAVLRTDASKCECGPIAATFTNTRTAWFLTYELLQLDKHWEIKLKKGTLSLYIHQDMVMMVRPRSSRHSRSSRPTISCKFFVLKKTLCTVIYCTLTAQLFIQSMIQHWVMSSTKWLISAHTDQQQMLVWWSWICGHIICPHTITDCIYLEAYFFTFSPKGQSLNNHALSGLLQKADLNVKLCMPLKC